jgi:hypothetical protein
MHRPPETRPRHRRYRVRRQARLDTETHAKLEALAHTFHRKRAQILRYVMQWGLTHTTGWTVDPSSPDRAHLVHMLVNSELLQEVQDAADAHGTSVAAWCGMRCGRWPSWTFRQAGARRISPAARMTLAITCGGFSSALTRPHSGRWGR